MKCFSKRFGPVTVVGLTLVFTSSVQAATHIVNQTGFTFLPANITVSPGDTIEWHWSSGLHTVTSGTPCTPDGVFFNQNLNSGNPLVTFVVPNDGTTSIPYFCVPHCSMGMTGTITISGAIPTVSEWGLTAMTLLIFTAGTLVLAQIKRVSGSNSTAAYFAGVRRND